MLQHLDQKIFAYYFAQYHNIPENNRVFGNNFTDWDLFKDTTNSKLTTCKFPLDCRK